MGKQQIFVDTGNGLVQSDTSSKANILNVSAVASLTLLVSANVRGRNYLLTARYPIQTATSQLYNSNVDCDN
jgi:hypothetical protein